MPIAQLYIFEGSDEEQRKVLIKEVTAAMSRSLKTPEDKVRIMISEYSKSNIGLGGMSAKELGR